jgi:hypothetical protein
MPILVYGIALEAAHALVLSKYRLLHSTTVNFEDCLVVGYQQWTS